jgi:hypothetical protein
VYRFNDFIVIIHGGVNYDKRQKYNFSKGETGIFWKSRQKNKKRV